jgi:hypothetical protein
MERSIRIHRQSELQSFAREATRAITERLSLHRDGLVQDPAPACVWWKRGVAAAMIGALLCDP